MEEFKVLFLGLPGAGKTMAIGTVSDIPVINTDVSCTSLTADFSDALKKTVTTGIDYGELNNGEQRFRLYGVPGHAHFDFLLDMIYRGTDIVIALFDITIQHPDTAFFDFIKKYQKMLLPGKSIIGITGGNKNYYPRVLGFKSAMVKLGMVIPIMPVDIKSKKILRDIVLMLAV